MPYMASILERLLEKKKKGIADLRRQKYISNSNTLEKLAGEPLDAVLPNMKKVEALEERINRAEYAAWTKSDLKLLLKMLWKEANGHDQEDQPKEIRWLKVGVPRKDKKHPKKISEEEITKMLKAAKGRDKAIIHLLYEAGLRPHELLSLKKSDVEFTKEGARIHVPEGTKTGARDILVIDCEPVLAGWCASHSSRSDEAVLFPASVGPHAFGAMSTVALNKIVKSVAKRAGVNRRIKPYDFRHTAASRLATILTDAQMKAYFGWTQDSSMAATYIDISGRDVDAPILAAHGRKTDRHEIEGKMEPQMCKRCGKQNAHDAQMCQYCGLSFNKEQAKSDMLSMQQEIKKMHEEQERMRKEMKEMLASAAREAVGTARKDTELRARGKKAK